MAPQTPQRSGQPGEPGPPLDLGGWIAGQRWFGSKSRRITATHVEDRLRVGNATLHLVRVGLDDGSMPTYVVPLRDGPGLRDAFDDPAFCRALLEVMRTGGRLGRERSALLGRPSAAFPADLPADPAVCRLTGEQSNTSVVFGERLIVKHFRHLVPGVSPELEMSRFLTEHAGFANTPRLAGALEYVAADVAAWTAGVQTQLDAARAALGGQIGRASCRERVCVIV